MPAKAPADAERRFARVAAWSVVLLATGASVGLHLTFLQRAGALWRDEASTVYLATLPSLVDVGKALPYDHCPPLVHMVIRAWWALGLASTDFSLRVAGVGIGLLLPVALWLAARSMRRDVPVVALALVACNPTVVAVGASFRGYGLGSATAVLMVACMWRLAAAPTARRALVAGLAAMLSVQALYQNAFFVFAACCGASAVALTKRRWNAIVWVAGVGGAAAASLLPYAATLVRAQEWYALEQSGFTFAHGWRVLVSALGSPVEPLAWVWVALALASLAGALSGAAPAVREAGSEPRHELALFGGITLGVGIVAFAFFLESANLPTQPWYYVPFMAFAAVCIEAAVPSLHRSARAALIALTAAIAALTYPASTNALSIRQTNIDEIATRIAQDASASDLVIVHPWYCGATFARYYRGRARWTTVPPLADHHLHRYDQVKEQLQKTAPIQPVIDDIARTLQNGGRVWLVGWIPLDQTPTTVVRPAPDNPWGWLDEQYSLLWGMEVGSFVGSHAQHGVMFMQAAETGVNPLENLPVLYAFGWR